MTLVDFEDTVRTGNQANKAEQTLFLEHGGLLAFTWFVVSWGSREDGRWNKGAILASGLHPGEPGEPHGVSRTSAFIDLSKEGRHES